MRAHAAATALTLGVALASVILFAGGNGILALSPTGIGSLGGNFLVRNRQRFADEGLLVAVVDAPSDYARGPDFRTTAGHVEDMKAVIAELRTIADVPVWLVGTSRGTMSAANVAARLTAAAGADGLVLTSTILTGGRESIYDVKLSAIRVPTLVVHHRYDSCKATPCGAVSGLMAKLPNAPRRELLTFDGGDSPRSAPCEALSRHGYFGIDREVVKAIADWIKSAK